MNLSDSGNLLLPPPLVESWFDALAERCAGTAAAHLPLVIWNDTIHAGNESIVYRHNDFFSLYIVRQGRGEHIIDGVSYGVVRGDVYAMGIGMTHTFASSENLVTDTLHFSPRFFDSPTLDALLETRGFQSLFVEEPLRRAVTPGSSRWLHLTPDAYTAIELSLGELRREWASGTATGVLLTRGLFLRLLVHLARLYVESEAAGAAGVAGVSAPHQATVAAAVRYFDAHFAEAVRIEQVAASVFLSPDRFTEVFAAIMGRTPRDYLRHVRVEQAKRLLRTTDLPVQEVGLASGFGEAAYFARAFRAATGTTPRAFRADSPRSA